MADRTEDKVLEELLAYGEPSQSTAFVDAVMHDVGRARRTRRLILFVFGLAGAVFGAIGAFQLSGAITALFAHLPPTATAQAALLAVAAVSFYGWFMNEDIDLAS